MSFFVIGQDIIGVEKAHLAGVSMGATVALYAASKQPHRVASVFAMSPLLQVEVRLHFDRFL